MFLNKWTVQATQPGQILETSFDSKDEALQYASQFLHPTGSERLVTLTLVDPNNIETPLTGSAGE